MREGLDALIGVGREQLLDVGFWQRGPGARPLAGFQGCPLIFSLHPLPKGAHKKTYT